MPQIAFAPAAIRDLQRLREFLRPKSVDAALRAGEAIRQGVQILSAHPYTGRMIDDLPEAFREWPIGFGDSGYVVRYGVSENAVTILAIRHQREGDFHRS